MENKPGINAANWADIAVGWGINPPVLGSQPWRKFTPLIQIPQSDPDFRCCSEETVVNHIYCQSRVADEDVPMLLFSAPMPCVTIQAGLQPLPGFFARHKVPQVTAQAAKTWAGSHTALPLSNCLVLAVPQICSSNPTPEEQWEKEGPGIPLTTLGLKGGWISLFSNFSQSILLKKACSLMSLSPSRPQPRRFAGCLVISCWEENTKQFSLMLGGKWEELSPDCNALGPLLKTHTANKIVLKSWNKFLEEFSSLITGDRKSAAKLGAALG